MTLNEEQLIESIGPLQVQRLHKWIRLGWVRPERHEGVALFHEVDIARVRLLVELEFSAEFDEETLPLILSLLDQVHGLRHELRSLAQAVDQQPLHVRERVRAAYRRIAES
jgi:chaperone modulatory protein CbpM